VSDQIREHPAALSASSCNTAVYSAVDHPRVAQKLAHDHALLHNPPTSRSVTHRFRTVLLQHSAAPLTCRPLLAATVLL